MRKSFLVFTCILSFNTIFCQNLIPNAGFENKKEKTVKYDGRNFNSLFKDWQSPSAAMPDHYSPLSNEAYRVPKNWHGIMHPHSGDSYAGFGANFGGTDLFAYLSVKLDQKLVKDSYYCFSLFISCAQDQVYSTNELDYVFSSTQLYQKTLTVIKTGNYHRFIGKKGFITQGRWNLISSCYRALGDEEYLTFGIMNNQYRRFKVPANSARDKLIGLYFYVDDVSLIQVKDTSECRCNEIKAFDPSATDFDLAVDSAVVLKNIFFKGNTDSLSPGSDAGLKELVNYLRSNTAYKIEITGFAGNGVIEKEKIKSGEIKAKSVAAFLITAGISKNRIACKGSGSMPLVKSGGTGENKPSDPRVEIKFIK